MISIYPHCPIKQLYLVNVGTPETRESVATLIEYVEKSSDRIVPPGIYEQVCAAYDRGSLLYRPGYKFTFGFDNEDAALRFHQRFGGELLPKREKWVLAGDLRKKFDELVADPNSTYQERFDAAVELYATHIRDWIDDQILFDIIKESNKGLTDEEIMDFVLRSRREESSSSSD